MSKWRPTDTGCLYVIPDIHGGYNLLQKVLYRILPLRTTGGVKDHIVFLGDYIDRHADSHLVLDKMVELKHDYPDQVHCLIGNHELLFMEALDLASEAYYGGNVDYFSENSYLMWVTNGGLPTLLGYMERNDIKENPNAMYHERIKDLIPKEHINFLSNDLVEYYIHDNFVFLHGGLDLNKPIQEQTIKDFAWDRSLNNFVLSCIKQNKELPWDNVFVVGHNHKGPVIKDKYLMLDCGAPKQMLVVELNSMEAFMIYPDKNRMIKYEMRETVLKKSSFRRV
jgi:serine/threonine protein phosphatase 1